MARTSIDKVEYFSHDAHASSSKTLIIIEGEFGITGYAFWWKLLETLANSDGHYYDARNEDDLEFLLRKCGVDMPTGKNILNKLARLNAIDTDLWGNGIIWSTNFVARLKTVYNNRGRNLPEKPDFCNGNNTPSDTPTTIPVTETPIPVTGIRQSKVKKESKVNKGISTGSNFPDWIDTETWEAFIAMRKKIKAPPTERAVQLLVKDLEKYKVDGDDPNEVINQSIKNGWKGLFPLNSNGNGRNGTKQISTRKNPLWENAE